MRGLGRARLQRTWTVLLVVAALASAAGAAAVGTAGPAAAGGAAGAGAVGTARPAAPGSAAAGPAQPAVDVDFPDPTVLVDGGTYYAYSTEVEFAQIQVTSSVDLTNWTPVGDALPTLPGWANPFHTWAPSVIKIGQTYVMYYTVQDAATLHRCISRATATAPLGPFTDTSTAPFICQDDHGGSIDPAVFLDTGGNLYLSWKSDDNSQGQSPSLWGQQLSADGSTLLGSPVQLLTVTTSWEGGIVEGPGMVAANGTYYLFHSGNAWNTASSAIGYATCTTPLGPCT